MKSHFEVAQSAAQRAGEILLHHFQQRTGGKVKQTSDGDQGLVTVADVEAERAITECILKSFPKHSILAEEEHQDCQSAEQLWVIDPLDGTNNFAHGIKQFAVSIAYYEKGRPVLGVIYDPTRGDWFTAQAGQGSWHNEKRVEVSKHKSLSETIVSTGFYYDRGKMMENTLEAVGKFFSSNVQGVRRLGAATLDLVGVGLGQFGGHFEFTLSPWDYAAARLFVEEAGGKVTDCMGNAVGLEKCSILASNSRLHESMLKIVSQYVE